MALEQKDIPLLLQIEKLKEELKGSKKTITNLQKRLESAERVAEERGYEKGRQSGYWAGRCDTQKEIKSALGFGDND